MFNSAWRILVEAIEDGRFPVSKLSSMTISSRLPSMSTSNGSVPLSRSLLNQRCRIFAIFPNSDGTDPDSLLERNSRVLRDVNS